MQFWSHSGQFYKNIIFPAHVHGQKCCQTEKLVWQPKSDMGMSYYEWVVNLVLNIIWFIVTILDMCKIVFFKYSLTHHKLKLSRRRRYNFFFSKRTQEEPKYIFQIIFYTCFGKWTPDFIKIYSEHQYKLDKHCNVVNPWKFLNF